jgi:plastocyanin
MANPSRKGWRSRLGLLVALVFAGCIAAACGADTKNTTETRAVPSLVPSVAASSTLSSAVSISDNQFSPASLTVTKGSKVTWNWNGTNPHSVVGTFDGQNVQSPTNTGSGTFTFTFNTPGTYNYQCGVHGAAMPGTIIVQ